MPGSLLNISIKILALVLAIFLWFNVITKKNYEYEITLPVKSIDLPADLAPLTPLPDSITIKVSAEGRKLLRADWKRSGLRLRGARLKQGYNVFEPSLESVILIQPDDITLVELINAQPFRLQLDTIDSIHVPVATRVTATSAEGFVVRRALARLSPTRVLVIGPASHIVQIDSIINEPRTFDRLNSSGDYPLSLLRPPGPSVTIIPDTVVLSLPIEPASTRVFDSVVVSAAGMERKRKTLCEPSWVAVEVTGPKSLLDTLSAGAVSAHLTVPTPDPPGYAVPEITVPDEVTVSAIRPDSVRIVSSP